MSIDLLQEELDEIPLFQLPMDQERLNSLREQHFLLNFRAHPIFSHPSEEKSVAKRYEREKMLLLLLDQQKQFLLSLFC